MPPIIADIGALLDYTIYKKEWRDVITSTGLCVGGGDIVMGSINQTKKQVPNLPKESDNINDAKLWSWRGGATIF